MKFLVIRKPRVGGALVATSKAIREHRWCEPTSLSLIGHSRELSEIRAWARDLGETPRAPMGIQEYVGAA